MANLRDFREKVNLYLYESKARNLTVLRITSFAVSLVAIASLFYFYGFPQTEASREVLLYIVQGSFAFYVLHYTTKLIYDFHPVQFLKRTWFQAVLMCILVIEGLVWNLFDVLLLEQLFSQLGMQSMGHLTALFIQVYILVIVANQITRTSGRLPKLKMHPAGIFMMSFLVLIAIGTALLMMPEMTTINGTMPFLDALFTSTSATCVTGLIVVDTATYFTFKGHLVILVLVKLGGLNIIAFGSFLALAAKFGLGAKHHSVIEDFVNRDNALSAKGMLGKIILWSVGIEALGAALIYMVWGSEAPFASTGERLFQSVFHSVSAFNNAGLSLFTDGLYNEYLQGNHFIHVLVTGLVFLGALGFTSIFDLFDPQRLRQRLKHPWKTIEFSTKISLYFSVGLVVLGVVALYLLEADNVHKDMSMAESLLASLFQSVTRTSGFNTVDIGAMAVPSLILLMFLMFVGSSSSSTGGGIKTSTFAILVASAWSTVRGKTRTELFKRSISKELTYRALAVFIFFVAGNLLAIFALTITESHILAMPDRSVIDLMFENVSALGTTGLSTGITPLLSTPGKVIIALSMFVGRVGTLTVAYAFGRAVLTNRYKYPYGHTMVG